MPLVDIAPSVPGRLFETPKGMALTPGALGEDPPVEPDRPGFLDALEAHFNQDNILFSAGAQEAYGASRAVDPDFDPWAEIRGTDWEQYWDRYLDVFNRAHFEAVNADIDRETEERKIIAATPWWQSVPMTFGANLLDPTILIPGGAFVRGVKGGVSVARSALNVGLATGAAVSIQEAALQATQQLRTVAESGTYIGASMLLGGLLGAGGAKLMSRAEWAQAVRAMDTELRADGTLGDDVPFPAPVGAAVGADRVATDLDALTVAGRAAGLTARATAFLNPGLRLAKTPSAVARDTAFNLFEMTQYLRGADQGIAAPRGVETLRKEWNAGLMKAVEGHRSAYSDYRKRVGRGAMKRDAFASEIGKAMRRGDASDIPEVARVAGEWRRNVFDPLKDAAIEAKLLPEDVTPETALSYFSRVYNRHKLTAEEHLFKNTVAEWLQTQVPRWRSEFEADAQARLAKANAEEIAGLRAELAAERAERFEDIPGRVREIANEVYDKLTGRMGDSVRPYAVTVGARGPLKGRTFMIPDETIERWLESDIDMVGRHYHRIMSADVEIARKFGDIGMTEQMTAIRDDFRQLRQATTDEKELARLAKAEKTAIDDLKGLRDLLRGTYDFANWEHNFGRIVRVSNMFNYIRSMGQVVLSSLPEAYRTAMVHGLGEFAGTVGKIGKPGFKMAVKEAKLAGNIGERILSHRLATLAEIGDFYTSRGPVEKFMANMTEIASTWNGIRLWTDWARMVAAVATQNRILTATADFGKASQRDRRYLAYLGIGEGMAGRIAKQMEQFGEIADGVRVANTEEWTDSVAVTAYRAAMNKDIDTQVVTRSVADIPLFANTPLGRILFQFNSFNLASHQRILLRGLQEGPARFVSGAIALTTIGMAVTYLQALAANRDVPDFAENPGWWIGEGLDKGGLFMVPMQVANAMEKLTGINPVKAPMKAFDEDRQQSMRLNNRNASSLLGPSMGLVEDVATVAGIPLTLAEGEDIREGQKNAAERLLPFNSYLGLRQMMRYVVNEPEAGFFD